MRSKYDILNRVLCEIYDYSVIASVIDMLGLPISKMCNKMLVCSSGLFFEYEMWSNGEYKIHVARVNDVWCHIEFRWHTAFVEIYLPHDDHKIFIYSDGKVEYTCHIMKEYRWKYARLYDPSQD